MAQSRAAKKQRDLGRQAAARAWEKTLRRKRNHRQTHGLDGDVPSSLIQTALAARWEWLAHRDNAKISALAIASPPEHSEAARRPWWVVVGNSSTRPLKPSGRARSLARLQVQAWREPQYVLMALAPESASPPSWRAEAGNILAHMKKAGAEGWPFIWQSAAGGDASSVWESGAALDQDDARLGWVTSLKGIQWRPLSGSRRERAMARIESIFNRRRGSRRNGRPPPEKWVEEFGPWAPAFWQAGGSWKKIQRDAAKEGLWPAVEAAKEAMLAAGATRVELCPNFMQMHPDALESREAFKALVESRCDIIRARWDIAHAAKELAREPRRRRPGL